MASEVSGMRVVEAEGKASVAMAKEDHVGHGAGDEQVGAHVELLPVQQQRVLDVPADTGAEPGAGAAWAVRPLQGLGQLLGTPATCPRCDAPPPPASWAPWLLAVAFLSLWLSVPWVEVDRAPGREDGGLTLGLEG